VLNELGEKMSKRNGAKAVTQYKEEGYLPDAMVNYLARLGWSHGDDEIFSREQFLQWFNLDHLGRSAAQFDEAKLRWVNAQHLKITANEELASYVKAFLQDESIPTDERLPQICGLFKDRCDTLVVLSSWVKSFYADIVINEDERQKHVVPSVNEAIGVLVQKLQSIDQSNWSKETVAVVLKEVLTQTGLKMPQLAMPVRVLLMGTSQTPSLDAVIALFDQQLVIKRLQNI
jgi:glutamyl-tRNA synthetase